MITVSAPLEPLRNTLVLRSLALVKDAMALKCLDVACGT